MRIKVALSSTPAVRVAIGETLRVAASILQAPQTGVTSWFPKLRAADATRERKADLVERPSDEAIRLADWALHARSGDCANWSADLDDAAAGLRLIGARILMVRPHTDLALWIEDSAVTGWQMAAGIG
jgi:hypothetical protein